MLSYISRTGHVGELHTLHYIKWLDCWVEIIELKSRFVAEARFLSQLKGFFVRIVLEISYILLIKS